MVESVEEVCDGEGVERVIGSKVGCWGRVVAEGRLIRGERGYRPLGWSWAIVPQTA